MRKFQAALCGLLILCGTMAFAAAGDVNSSYVTQENAQANFVALTAATNTATFDVGKALPSNHSVLAVVTGGPATCTISLQATQDGVTWDTISGPITCTSSVTFYVSGKPASGIRANLTALTGGTSPTVTVFYSGVHGASSAAGTVTSGQASAVTQGGTPMMCDSATSGAVTAGQAQMVRCNTLGVLANGLSAAAADGTAYNGGALIGSNASALVPVVLPELVATGTSLYSRQYICDKTAKLNALAATTTEIVALAASQKIYVCSMVVSNNNATATTLKLVEGTGTNCATGQTNVTALMNIGATSTAPVVISLGANAGWVTTTAADALCLTSSAASSLEITITYVQHN